MRHFQTAPAPPARPLRQPFPARRAIISCLLLAIGVLLIAVPRAEAASPTATTLVPTNAYFEGATLRGEVNPSGQQLEECVFEYGESQSYGQSVQCSETASEIGSGSSDVPVEASLTGLSQSTEYHVRIRAKNASGSAGGGDQTFSTPEPPAWQLTVSPNADFFIPGKYLGTYLIEAEDTGGPIGPGESLLIKDILPPDLAATGSVNFFDSAVGVGGGAEQLAQYGLCPTPVECEYPGPLAGGLPPIKHGDKFFMDFAATVPPTASGALVDKAQLFLGGVLAEETQTGNQANPDPPSGIQHFESILTDSSENSYLFAGGHPDAFMNEFDFLTFSNTRSGRFELPGQREPIGDPKEIVTKLPPGLIANPQAVPHCALADYFAQECPRSTVVGEAGYKLFEQARGAFRFVEPVYNLQPTGAYPGELGLPFARLPIALVSTSVRSGSDYGITAKVIGVPESGLTVARIQLWGVPAESRHDPIRNYDCQGVNWDTQFLSRQAIEAQCEADGKGGPAEVPETPFMRTPTACPGLPISTTGESNTWQDASSFSSASEELGAMEGCDNLRFESEIQSRPTTSLADSPSGLNFQLHIPQGCWLSQGAAGHEALCQSDLQEAIVSLPRGLSVNPSSAGGLQGCSPEEIGLDSAVGQTPAHFSEAPGRCPDASKIGSAIVDTPLLHNPLEGSVYLAAPHQNPFGTLLAAYIVLEGEGLIIKLPGSIETDPETGQITGRFLENPQLPFEDFHLEFFGGARGDLRTPPACGSYWTAARLTPWSHTEAGAEATPIAEPTASFETAQDPQGGPCPASQPNSPTFRAGTESPQAGAFTPFSLRVAREDGSQEFSKIETTLPPGLSGRLAGVAECSEAQLALARSREHEGGGAEEFASPSCPASSELGSVEVASGAGPTPLHVTGKAYLAGPYKGAPLSLAIITPAIAGPFDLGDVLVRSALQVDPETTQIKAVSDPIPHILDGIPLDVRSIILKIDRPNFTLNPTDCEELGFSGTETSLLRQIAPLTQRFQVGGCQALPFKPKLSLSMKGQTKRTGDPALTAVLTMPPGNANIAKAQVTLPRGELVDQGHIGDVCARSAYLAGSCPPSAVIGHARAITPLLQAPLEGPVYLVSGYPGHTLPDVAADLGGQIRVLLHGKTDSVHEALRNTFEVVPDAPVSKFTLSLLGGKKGLIENSHPLCAKKRSASALFTAQSGRSVELNPTVKVRCPKKKLDRHHHHHRSSHRIDRSPR